ncbi:MAG: UDP-N-acetylmuramate--L-alanine ligase [Acidobacteria bacterium]|uniref:UDP-N-acetylmuramate--L-alanine ligase n=1 Tax=Candidatus Polarisedimenticola svalbardensis TaxID=2886004 RepID=A0A8J7CCR9_9BACT|nr:UDP-N-acetylmuramate--L-alanine ligase [Candidatus Polarisedimenticola svalbardensis]
MFRKARHLHFVGIGGTGMSGIAEVLVNLGYPVSGSDLSSNPATRRLKKMGARIHKGHRLSNLREADVVVISSAVRPDNPEVVEARRLKIPVIPRAEMLAELMRLKTGIAVAGAHGKTTTTALVAEVLDKGKLDPTVVIGGRVGKLRSGAKLGKGDLMVAEADESDGSFLKMKPTIAIVTNIDREHLDHYDDLTDIQDTFVEFLSRLPFYGVAVVCLDDPNVRSILPRVDRKVITYGLSSEADISAVDVSIDQFESSYTVSAFGEQVGRITVALPGRHSVYNSLAAVAVAMELEIPFQTIARALKSFRGVERRFQLRGRYNDALVVDDYGHHPTEIEAVLNGVREGFGARTIVVFQPHRFSRTQALLEEFGGAFHLADIVFVTDIYPAGEEPVSGVDGSLVQDALVRHGHPDVRYVKDHGAIIRQLRELLQPGDVMITLGAGDVWKIGDSLAKSGKKQGRRKR